MDRFLQNLDVLGFARSYAPGLEPSFYDRALQRFADVPLPPDILPLLLVCLAPVAVAGVAGAKMRRRRRLADEGIYHRPKAAARRLASLRHTRMARVSRVRHLDEI